nr:hypothetical protein [Micromonospora sp. DSM 115978]
MRDQRTAAILRAVAGLPAVPAAVLLAQIGHQLVTGQTVTATAGPRPGPNDVLPCGTESARMRHLAHGQTCRRCMSPPAGGAAAMTAAGRGTGVDHA